MVLDTQLLAKIFECFVIKLLSTIGDKDFRDPKAIDNAFPIKVLDVLLSDGGQGFRFNPFDKVIDSHDKELELSYCHRNGPMMSSPHWVKGYGAFIGVSYSDGWRTILLKC